MGRLCKRVGWGGAAVLTGCAIFLFAAAAPPPIMLWDESRNAVNALEMVGRGMSSVTTYGGVPDLWNTKPPLLIWAMAGSVALFGGSEWTLRLPGMVAALLTLALVMIHALRATGSRAIAVLTAVLLTASPAQFGEHGARTADYDSLLTLFTTAYCCLAFAALRQRRAGAMLVGAAGLAVAGAVLTKNVAGLVPGVGLALFALTTGRWRRVMSEPAYLVAAVAAIVPVAVFVLVREAAAPGWLAAVWRNDLGGRFAADATAGGQPWHFYLTGLAAGYFAAPLLVAATPFVWRLLRPRERLAAAHAGWIVLATLLIASAAATKLHHYIYPALPFMAVLAAIVAVAAGRWLVGWWRGDKSLAVAAVLGMILAVSAVTAARGAVLLRYLAPLSSEGARAGGYGALFAAVAPQPVEVVDPGFVLEGQAGYAPVLRTYQLLAAMRGQRVARIADVPSAGLVASCDPSWAARLPAMGAIRARTPDCVLVAR